MSDQSNVTPLVSVIIPCYNMERYLAQTLDSVLTQTHRNLEVIVVDDSSTDSSAQMVRDYMQRDQRIHLLQKPNGGPSAARNMGIKHSRGVYIALLDGDDYWDPTKIEKHVAQFESRPDVAVSYSGTQFVNQRGEPLHKRIPETENLSDYYLYCRNPITNGSTPFFRREVFDEHLFDESPESRSHEDVECWMRIAFTPPRRWKFAGIPEPLTYYRVTPGSLSDNYVKHHTAAQHSWKKSFEYAPELAKRFARLAEAFQMRFYARRAIAARNGKEARHWMFQAIKTDPRILVHEPLSSWVTLAASLVILAKKPKP